VQAQDVDVFMNGISACDDFLEAMAAINKGYVLKLYLHALSQSKDFV